MKSTILKTILFIAFLVTPGLILLGVALYNTSGKPKYIDGICLTSTHKSQQRDLPVEIIEFSKILEVTPQQYKVVEYISTLNNNAERKITKKSAPKFIAIKHFESTHYRVPCRSVGQE